MATTTIRPTLLPTYVTVARTTVGLFARRQLTMPRTHVGMAVAFADGSRSTVYRETRRVGVGTAHPTLVVVQFRLRYLGRSSLLHAAFRAESLANTFMFAGFDGFRSKLWLTDRRTGVYRGVYEWDGAEAAQRYTAALCPLLEVFSEAGTVRAHVEPGVPRDAFLGLTEPVVTLRGDGDGDRWWTLERRMIA